MTDAELLGETVAAAAAESTLAEAVLPATGTIDVTNLLPSGFVRIDGTNQESPEGIVVSSGEPHEIAIGQASYQTIIDTLTLTPGQILTTPAKRHLRVTRPSPGRVRFINAATTGFVERFD